MHILQTRKINEEGDAITDQLVTIMQQGTGGGSAALAPRSAYRRVKTREAKSLCTAGENTTETPGSKWWELTSRIKTDSSHTTRWKDKKKRRDQYDLKQSFHKKLLTSDWTSSPQCLRRSHYYWSQSLLWMASGPICDISVLRFTKTAEEQAWFISA